MNRPQTTYENPAIGHDSRVQNGFLMGLFFLSGFSALVYEVLWLKELGLLFGNTAYAASTTLGAFFFGLSVGGFFWGRRSATIKNPLRTYAYLEFGIFAAALFYLLVSHFYYRAYPALFAFFNDQSSLFLLVKFLLAASLLFLPAFFMGGTFPMMGQQMIRQREQLGRQGALLYAVNTVGAAAGAFVAGFYLPMAFGYRNAYLLACAINAGIGLATYLMSRREKAGAEPIKVAEPMDHPTAFRDRPSLPWLIGSIAFLSGFITLSLEVLWTQMFKQVLQNSVYSFSAVLVTFLVALAVGSIAAHLLCRLERSPYAIMTALMMVSGVSIYISPLIFYRLTHGLEEMSLPGGWNDYVQGVFGLTAMVIFVPCIVMGMVFPYLLKMYQKKKERCGATIGRLTAINTIGAILGSLCAGFVLSGLFDVWTSIKLMAALYFLTAIFVMPRVTRKSLVMRVSLSAGLLLFLVLVYPFNFPLVKVSAQEHETLYHVWQGSYGTVAVIRRGNDLKIKINNTYDIGGSASVSGQTWQARIPLFLHPDPKRVFFLGMGTGITAGGALDHSVEEVVVCELIPEVVKASRRYFNPIANHLYDDPRVRILVEDGRNYLLGTRERYDVIISDLFTPWHAGIGSLYTAEHFRSVRNHLHTGGLFAQWLPLAQMSREEFSIIAKTMTEVFPQVTLWRLNTPVTGPIVALIGENDVKPLDVDHVDRNVQTVLGNKGSYVIPYLYYVGNITANRDLFAAVPINTENHPVIEYLSPITRQKTQTGTERNFVAFDFIQFYDQLLERLPPERDAYLADLDKQQVNTIHAGLSLYKIDLYRMMGRMQKARQTYQEYLSYLPLDIYPELK